MQSVKGYEAQESGRGVLELALTVEKIECARLSEKASPEAKSNYKLNVSLSEKHRRPEGLVLSFNLELTGSPQVAKIVVEGTAKLVGSKKEIDQELTSSSEKGPPRVVEAIYDKLYGLLYLLAGSMRVPYPPPNLLKSK